MSSSSTAPASTAQLKATKKLSSFAELSFIGDQHLILKRAKVCLRIAQMLTKEEAKRIMLANCTKDLKHFASKEPFNRPFVAGVLLKFAQSRMVNNPAFQTNDFNIKCQAFAKSFAAFKKLLKFPAGIATPKDWESLNALVYSDKVKLQEGGVDLLAMWNATPSPLENRKLVTEAATKAKASAEKDLNELKYNADLLLSNEKKRLELEALKNKES